MKRHRGFHAPDPAGAPRPALHISPRPALVSYRVALALHPATRWNPDANRREEDTGMDTLTEPSTITSHHRSVRWRAVGYRLATVLAVADEPLPENSLILDHRLAPAGVAVLSA